MSKGCVLMKFCKLFHEIGRSIPSARSVEMSLSSVPTLCSLYKIDPGIVWREDIISNFETIINVSLFWREFAFVTHCILTPVFLVISSPWASIFKTKANKIEGVISILWFVGKKPGRFEKLKLCHLKFFKTITVLNKSFSNIPFRKPHLQQL